MKTGVHKEISFEDAIERHLLDRGWLKGSGEFFDRELALDTDETFAFIGATQGEPWETLVARHGGDQGLAQTKFRQRLADEIDRRGAVDVLRRGVKDLGVQIDLAYFRPASGITPALIERYDANRCTVTRQLAYSAKNDNTLDLTLLVNGIPVVTAELKNPLSGQDVERAKKQYRTDRDPRERIFAKRAVAHFAVDPDLAFMTTRLAGNSTRFLPFNQGTGGAGREGGAGNPPSTTGHRTAYLWEEVWQRDALLDLLARFVHVDPASLKQAPNVIFPRYHQWDAVRKLVADACERGAGHSYLVQHSAGSGKSNTIAWTAHRLASLHDTEDRKIFDKVIVITDRVVLDRQLQETVFQFEHRRGVVARIEKDSSQLAAALDSAEAKIVITTLQKFPFVIEKVSDLSSGRYAIVVDEAHSSQTGETAKALKDVLGSGAGDHATRDLVDDDEGAEPTPEDVLQAAVETRGRQPNLSFFAFTATPKGRTLELFGESDGTDKPRAFHLYSMRQAIEEGFIEDVLANYLTYRTYFKLERAQEAEDPELPSAKAAAAIARFVSLHPSNVAQKVEVIVEHFRRHTAGKLGGRAKAMVVTRSRKHAVRYKRAIDGYLAERGYHGIKALVAFSGTVADNGAEFTETQMNGGLPESQLPERFADDEQRLLVVAEKYQTGFDQPLLHTMYVDKKLEGVRAVQTLSRLNRIHPDKDDTFVLDFANDAQEIQEAFAPFFEATVGELTDPNVLYNASGRVEGFGVITPEDLDPFYAAFASSADGATGNAALYKLLEPAVGRFQGLEDEQRDEFREALKAFVRLYSFLGQVLTFADPELEKLYTYARFLALRLPSERDPALDLSDEVELSHLRTQLIGEHDLSLVEGDPDVGPAFAGEGIGPVNDPPTARLSEIIGVLNERFGTEFTKADQVFVDQIEQAAVEDDMLAAQARANTLENFRLGFDPALEALIVERLGSNEQFFGKMLDDPEFGRVVTDYLAQRVYGRLRE